MENLKEIWKDIEGFEGLYQVSNLGKVRSLDRKILCKNGTTMFKRGKELSGRSDSDGYLEVTLSNKKKTKYRRIHRLVAEAFVDNVDQLPMINHINEIKDDNKACNLEWVNNRQNVNYSTNKNLTSIHPGVHWHKRDKRWIAEISINGKKKRLCCSKIELEAAKAYTDFCDANNIKYKVIR